MTGKGWARDHPCLEGLAIGCSYALVWTVAMLVAAHKDLGTTLLAGASVGGAVGLFAWATSAYRHDPDRVKPRWHLWAVVAVGVFFLAAMGYGHWRGGS